MPESHLVSDDAGLGPTLLYDTRDNIFTPTRGGKAEVSAILHDPAVGGDFNYQMYNAKGMAWLPVHSAVTLALRLDGSLSEGDAPFYTLPFIMLRGIPAMRYQDEVAVMGEVEARWQISARWSVLGFTGAGRAADTVDELGSATSRHTVGTGFRYLIARKFGMHSGVDVARGPDGTYAYLMVGSAF